MIRETELNPGSAGHARAGRVARYFHIGDEYGGEGYVVDFWFMQPVAVRELLAASREASLTDEWQTRLQRSLDRYFSREARRAPVNISS